MRKLLAVLSLVLSLLGFDLARGADVLCRYTLLPAACRVGPALERGAVTPAPDPVHAPPQPHAAPYSESTPANASTHFGTTGSPT